MLRILVDDELVEEVLIVARIPVDQVHPPFSRLRSIGTDPPILAVVVALEVHVAPALVVCFLFREVPAVRVLALAADSAARP